MEDISMMNVLDLFCGCGGLSNGFEQEGYNVLLGIDSDERALNTYRENHDNAVAHLGDITNIKHEDISQLVNNKLVDIVIGGPPCQGMSLSGLRKFDDPRNKLYLSYIRLVEEIKPKAFVIENVPGLVSLYKGRVKDSIIEKFTRMGYEVNYEILNASDYGIPQNRKRVFFVGLKNGKFEFNFEKKSSKITTKMALDDLPPLEETIGEEVMDYIKKPNNEYQKLLRINSTKVYNHIAARHSKRIKDIISLVPDGGNYKDLPEEFRSTRKFNVAWTRFPSDRPSPTIDTGHRHHFHYKYNRVPTVRECARLQSFSDDFIFTGNKTDQFRQVGNAVPPLLSKLIARELKNYL